MDRGQVLKLASFHAASVDVDLKPYFEVQQKLSFFFHKIAVNRDPFGLRLFVLSEIFEIKKKQI